MYAVENGYYFLNKEPKEKVISYLRITEEEYNALHGAGDKSYFKFLLYTLSIVARWKEEADTAIKELEALTGCKWVNPYEYDKERKHISITEEEVSDINNKIETGYYTPEAITARYDHTNKVVFNWLDYKDKISQGDFVDFLNNVDYSKLPEGITFEIK